MRSIHHSFDLHQKKVSTFCWGLKFSPGKNPRCDDDDADEEYDDDEGHGKRDNYHYFDGDDFYYYDDENCALLGNTRKPANICTETCKCLQVFRFSISEIHYFRPWDYTEVIMRGRCAHLICA